MSFRLEFNPFILSLRTNSMQRRCTEVRPYVTTVFCLPTGYPHRKRKMSGFGHRVYKNYDHRAKVIRKLAEEVFSIVGRDPLILRYFYPVSKFNAFFPIIGRVILS